MVTEDPSTGEFVVYFIEDGPWPDGSADFAATLHRIQDIVFDCADAAIDGGIAKVYPDSVGKKVRIQVDSPSGCPDRLFQLVKNADHYLAASESYSAAISKSKFISGIRVVTGHMLGRFREPQVRP
jgi:hypothetical protein